MLIKNLFERDIFRPINGVVKADQLDESSVWQELDEFVITRELDQHLNRFISWYLEAVDQGSKPDPSGKMGIWISGFFGSGKSHFLKVLSYLLQNRAHTSGGETKQAVEFFESKVTEQSLERLRDDIERNCPLHRIGHPEEMAGVAIYLASRAGAYTNGVVIPVDGGTSVT